METTIYICTVLLYNVHMYQNVPLSGQLIYQTKGDIFFGIFLNKNPPTCPQYPPAAPLSLSFSLNILNNRNIGARITFVQMGFLDGDQSLLARVVSSALGSPFLLGLSAVL